MYLTECVYNQVGPKDTLNSIALKFNITPNKLVHLNRLYSHSVVPGQVSFLCCSLICDSIKTKPNASLYSINPTQKLFVPDVDQSERSSQVNGSSEHLTASEKELKVRRFRRPVRIS